ncbi:MAG: divalent-cation tolerance protein CutA [Gemmatimonadota bacterium]
MSAEDGPVPAPADAAAGGTRLVFVTGPDPETATRLVRTLVEEGVAACGNILPGIRSVYRWQGRVEEEAEALVLFKTTAAGAERLVHRIPELHPYDVPEVLVVDVEAGYAPYLQWVAENVSPQP